jgi:hypothetical protein
MQKLLDQAIAAGLAIMCVHRGPADTDMELRYELRPSELAQDHATLVYAQTMEPEIAEVASALKIEVNR